MTVPAWEAVAAGFTWDPHLRALGWTAGGGVNLGRTIVDRHPPESPALRWVGKDGRDVPYTFRDLSRLSDRVAHLLRGLGVGPGDRVGGFLPRVPETLAVMLGTWKLGAVYVPVFTGFGPDAIRFRAQDSGTTVFCTHHDYRGRLPAPFGVPAAIVTIAGPAGQGVEPGDIDFHAAVERQPAHTGPWVECRRDHPAVLLYTSGSTGPPKGVTIAANFLLAVHPYMQYAVDLRAGDVFWPTGDPGWGYGLVCYMVALAMGMAVTLHEPAPTPEFALRLLRDRGVTNLATTPTLLRSLMALGADVVRRVPVRVRCASSCGEPLNPEVIAFFRALWGVTVMDQYGASEFGLPLGNFNGLAMAVKPGAMGLPLPGCTVAIVDDVGRELPPGAVGDVALRPSPEGFYALGYWNDPERDREFRRGGWITIGDLGRRDEDGYFWFEGRADDVIKSAGYRIGPFEVESAILQHPAVAEAAVVGAPDGRRGQIVKAFVVVRPGRAPSPALGEEIVEVVKRRLGHHLVPRALEFLDELPKTETGKIQRFRLRHR
jgi:acetyl-CoA synthetase